MWNDWVARLSGPVSVPAAALSYWVSNDIGKTIFAFTAFACVWITAYRLWKPLEEKIRPKLKLSYAADKTLFHHDPTGTKQTFLRVVNESAHDIEGAQVIVRDLRFRKQESDPWESSNIIATPNMSWCQLPDGDTRKFAATQLPPGGHLLDFITGPATGKLPNGVNIRGFRFRVDPRHTGIVSFFHRKGTYKFTVQASALDAGKPEHLILFVNWSGKDYSVGCDNDILEPIRDDKKDHATV
jgi:hypothetical protein